METRDPIQRLREELSRKPLFSERNGYKPLDREPLLAILGEIEAAYVPREEHDERIEELEAQIEAEREEVAFFESERSKIYTALADMKRTHMKLPVGADGLPIRLGDVVAEEEFRPEGGTVIGMKTYISIDHWMVNCGAWVDCRKCRHVKHDTVEDTVEDIIAAAMSFACEPEAPYSKNSKYVQMYAYLIRNAIDNEGK